jgi:hypothetical protein
MMKATGIVFLVTAMAACSTPDPPPDSYQYDFDFLSRYIHVIELKSGSGQSRVLISPAFQGRVMTSTATGSEGNSYGWINYELIRSGEIKKQFNPVGGEERFWLGPEGGPFALYFPPGKDFSIENWQVPACIDTEPFDVIRQTPASVTFGQSATLTNYSHTIFKCRIERTVSLLKQPELENALKFSLPDRIKIVAYQTENKLTNAGEEDWKKETGLPSIWLLGMFRPSDKTVAMVPFHPHPDARKKISTDYFGEIPADRLLISDSVLYFTCDGKYRSKLGIAPSVAKPVAASFDFQKNMLTIILFDIQSAAPYVNSKWSMAPPPFSGDAVNVYNDGPLEGGGQLGPFYELESSSPALELKAGEQAVYRQLTAHFEGEYELLRELSVKLLGVDLNTIRK